MKHLLAIASSVTLLIAGPLGVRPAAANPVNVEHFAGSENWPVLEPGQLRLDNSSLTHIRVGYAMVFGETGTTTGYMDVDKVLFRGKPAHWVQWKFTAEEEGIENGWPSFDLLILDQPTGALLARTAPSRNPRGDWGGPYSSIEVRDGKFRRLNLGTDGSGELIESQVEGPFFDFGALGFVLPFIDAKPGDRFRLQTYLKSLGDAVVPFPISVTGYRTLLDAKGRSHRALAMDALSPDGSAIVTFYVARTAPYFFGWDYRNVSDGTTLFRMDYRGFVDTTIGTGQ